LTSSLTLLGCDFTSRPTRQKPITVALATLDGDPRGLVGGWDTVVLNTILRFDRLLDFEKLLTRGCPDLSGPWVGGFDLPFGLPRELIQTLGWPLKWDDCVQYFCSLERDQIREKFKDFCAPRPAGSKFAHRSTDYIARSSPSMKWVNPPVAFMMHSALPVLIRANLSLPGIRSGDNSRIGLETYPGMLAREIIGHQSYKSDDKQKQTQERQLARQQLLKTLQAGKYSLGLKLQANKALSNQMLEDASGDSLDAVICAVQAAWGVKQFNSGDPMYGLPHAMDPLEGWILTC